MPGLAESMEFTPAALVSLFFSSWICLASGSPGQRSPWFSLQLEPAQLHRLQHLFFFCFSSSFSSSSCQPQLLLHQQWGGPHRLPLPLRSPCPPCLGAFCCPQARGLSYSWGFVFPGAAPLGLVLHPPLLPPRSPGCLSCGSCVSWSLAGILSSSASAALLPAWA